MLMIRTHLTVKVLFSSVSQTAGSWSPADGALRQVDWMAGAEEGGKYTVSGPGQQWENNHHQQTQTQQCKSGVIIYVSIHV